MTLHPDSISQAELARINRPERSPDQSVHAAEHAHVQSVRFEVSERTLSVTSLAASVAAFVTALWSIHESDLAARETKQLQIQVMDHNALLLREGLLQPTDETYGPAGNLAYKKAPKHD